jgi:hypothetical protein
MRTLSEATPRVMWWPAFWEERPNGGWRLGEKKMGLWLIGEKEHADRETDRQAGELRDRPVD